MGTWYTNQNPIGMLITVLKNRVADEEGGEWSAPEMIDGSLAFFLWGKRGWWNCGADRHGPDGCGIKDQEGFWLSVQSFSSGACPPFPTSFEEAASSPHVPRARMWLEPGIDHSTKIFLDADKEWQPLFERLVSELVEPVQTQKGAEPRTPKPTAETERRANLFRSIKNEHPSYSYEKVALEATRRERVKAGKGEKPTEYHKHNVRDAYSAMGWQWERGDKIR
jgi:hypothetical protein